MSQHESADDERVALAIGEYVLGNQTLGEAADLANLGRWEFRDLLIDRGVQLRNGPRSTEEARAEVEVALRRNE